MVRVKQQVYSLNLETPLLARSRGDRRAQGTIRTRTSNDAPPDAYPQPSLHSREGRITSMPSNNGGHYDADTSNNNDTLSRRSPSRHHKSNRNIRLTMIYTCIAFAGRSIWGQSVLATYVYLITDKDPRSVGNITAVMGAAQLLASIPTGYLVDRYRRDTMLRVASVVGVLAILVTLLALHIPSTASDSATSSTNQHHNYALLGLALAVWGLMWGIANTALGALFADSIADGDRAYYFTQRAIILKVGNATGPILALIMFAVLGDHWTIEDCAVVMTLGQTLCLPAVLLLAFFNDDDGDRPVTTTTTTNTTIAMARGDTLGINYEAISEEEAAPIITAASNNSEDDLLFDAVVDADFDEDVELQVSEPIVESTDNTNRDILPALPSSSSCEERSEYVYGCIPRKRAAPILISLADLTSGIASGMSIRYFPIFFVDTLHLSPVQVQILYIIGPVLQPVLMKSGQHFSERFGRCQITLLYKWVGISCMALLVVFSKLGLPSWMICIVYVLRTAFMNSTTPLTKSILMDSVPKEERGRWSSMESVSMFSWSGSAALGGILVSLNGLLFNFSITASMQLVATMPVLALMWVVNVDELTGS